MSYTQEITVWCDNNEAMVRLLREAAKKYGYKLIRDSRANKDEG